MTSSPNEYVFSDSTQSNGLGRFRSVRSREFKYVRELVDRTSQREHLTLEKTAFSPLIKLVVANEVLFDIDAGESVDVKRDHRDESAELRRVYEDWDERNAEASETYVTVSVLVDDEVREELKHLGYLQ